MVAFPTVLFLALSLGAQAVHQCTSCVPLEDLLSEGYGIELTRDGLSSAVAFHNGTMKHVSTSIGSSEYRTKMRAIVDTYIGLPPQPQIFSCRTWQQHSFQTSSFSPLKAVFSYLSSLWKQNSPQQPTTEASPAPIDVNVHLFQTEMEALSPFKNMSDDQKSKVSVAILIPGWLTGTDEVCQIAEAASRTFRRSLLIETHPSASYTAMGYELCRTDYEYFDCTGPGRIATVDFQAGNLVVISQIQTPVLYWAANRVTFAVSQNLTQRDMIEWIDSFIETHHPDMVMVTGPEIVNPHLKQIIELSRAQSLLIDQTAVPAERVAVMGAAQAAKDDLERQFDDCHEPEDCYAIRREANRIAGGFDPPKPTIWAAVALRRFRDEL